MLADWNPDFVWFMAAVLAIIWLAVVRWIVSLYGRYESWQIVWVEGASSEFLIQRHLTRWGAERRARQACEWNTGIVAALNGVRGTRIYPAIRARGKANVPRLIRS